LTIDAEHGTGVGGGDGLAPAHTPLVQASPVVPSLPSLQAVPSAAFVSAEH
jgi:hypothetical protein